MDAAAPARPVGASEPPPDACCSLIPPHSPAGGLPRSLSPKKQQGREPPLPGFFGSRTRSPVDLTTVAAWSEVQRCRRELTGKHCVYA